MSAKKFYSPWEIDDYLLNPLEDVGTLERNRVVNFKMVHAGFSYYLETVFKYTEIDKYINQMNDDENNVNQNNIDYDDIFYGHARYIMTKCCEYDTIHDGPCKWLWIIKRQMFRCEPKYKRVQNTKMVERSSSQCPGFVRNGEPVRTQI